MAATYQFRILTPATALLEAEIESLVAPGEAGYLGVLANHAPLITTLKPGILKVRTVTGEKWFRVSGGILRVVKNQAIVLSEIVEEVPVEQAA